MVVSTERPRQACKMRSSCAFFSIATGSVVVSAANWLRNFQQRGNTRDRVMRIELGMISSASFPNSPRRRARGPRSCQRRRGCRWSRVPPASSWNDRSVLRHRSKAPEIVKALGFVHGAAAAGQLVEGTCPTPGRHRQFPSAQCRRWFRRHGYSQKSVWVATASACRAASGNAFGGPATLNASRAQHRRRR